MTRKEELVFVDRIKQRVIREIKRDYLLVARQATVSTRHRQDFIESVLQYVCIRMGIDLSSAKSNNRSMRLVHCRSITAYIIKSLCYENVSLKLIGDVLNRDHSSVIHNLKILDLDMDHDANLKLFVAEVMEAFKADYGDKILKITNPKIKI